MSRLILASASILALSLTGCNPQQMGMQNKQQQQQMVQNDPYANSQPAPYMQNGPQPGQWPGSQPQPQPVPGQPNAQMPMMPGQMPNPMPNPMPGQGPGALPPGAPLQLTSAPAGMQKVPSQAGYVYRAQLNGQGPVPQQSRDFYIKLMPYFDSQPMVMGYLDEPSGRMAQVGFQSTKNGAPVMGMLVVSQGQNGTTATVLLDSPDRFQQSMQTMMAAAQQP